MRLRLRATTTFTRIYDTEVYGNTVEETVALEQAIYDNEPLDTALERYAERNLGPDDDKTVVELAEVGRQPDEAPVEALEGPEPGTETPEAAAEAPGGAEPVEPEPDPTVFTRADAAQAMALLLSGRGQQPSSGWSEAERQAEQRLDSYRLGRIDGECTHPEPPPVDTAEAEPTICRYGHTRADHDRVGACERPGLNRRPHWLPELVWMGVIVGQWPIQAFPSREMAKRWADAAVWSAERQAYEQRRIWAVEIPVDTQTFRVETVPASTRLIKVTG